VLVLEWESVMDMYEYHRNIHDYLIDNLIDLEE
jgi:hypothetical protein